jgi:phosphoenolpyruvate-protein phosphotransferase (PTS system enzyme I)
MQRDESEELRIQGVPVSEGIAIGIPYFLATLQEESIPEFPIAMGEIESEIARYRRALFSSRKDLERLQTDLESEGSTDAITIIDTHIQMLEDPLITTHMEERIRHMRQNTESVFRSVINEYEKKFSQTQDTFFQERLVDVMDISKRILGHLCPTENLPLDIPANSILFANELNPSETAAMQTTCVQAFVTERGGGNSHAALIARAKGIPFVANIDLKLLQNIKDKWIIVDGMTGEIVINPYPETLRRYKELKKQLKTRYQLLEQEGCLSAQTLDGYQIRLSANIGLIEEVGAIHKNKIEGIGLFRSEYLLLDNPSLVTSEEKQYQLYLQILKKARGLPVVIRVFDLGGDKYPNLYLEREKELNPLLGCRGIRFLLHYKEIFRIQLRALYRASPFGNLSLLIPLISDVEELQNTKKLIQEVKEELMGRGTHFLEEIPLGCMIEVPSAALICDDLMQECAFLSIGTNDLIQYVLGIDRSNALMSHACYPAHPSVIRLLQMIISRARYCDKSVSICGEIASNPLFIPLLLGLGIREISCSPRFIPSIKQIIRRCYLHETQAFAASLLPLSSSSEIAERLTREYRRLLPEG